jgi:hypothetical protein
MKLSYRKPITSLSEEQIEIFLSHRFGDKKKGGTFLGFGVGPGWSDIIYDLHKKLVEEKPDYVIHQVKEKFGTLRYYTGPLAGNGHVSIAEAERLSSITCEECGRPGKLRTNNYWLRTLCDYDSFVDRVNKHLWNIQKGGLTFFFRHYFAIRRFNRKRKESAKNRVF